MFRNKLRWLAIVISITLLGNPVSLLIDSKGAFAEESAVEETPAAPEAAPTDLKLEVKSAILIEAETGQVLFEFNSGEGFPPASMAKMMTEYIILEKIKSGTLKWTDMVTISEYASDVIGSGQLLFTGETYSIEDLFKDMSIYSANDASVALAEHVSGTEENFAKLMNETAKEFGLSSSAQFINATGLSRKDMKDGAPASIGGETILSAKDASIIAFHIVNDHPEALEYSKVPQAYLREGDENSLMTNWNWMLEGWKSFDNNFTPYAYPGLDGLKTGHTSDAGNCFTGTAVQNGMRTISVVMGAQTERKRFEETKKLLDYGFSNFEKRIVLTAKTEMAELKTVKVRKGVKLEVGAVTDAGIEFIARKSATPDQFVTTITALEEKGPVAPVDKGQLVGKVSITYMDNGKEMKQEVNLIAADEVAKAGWFKLFMRSVRKFFNDIFAGIKKLF